MKFLFSLVVFSILVLSTSGQTKDRVSQSVVAFPRGQSAITILLQPDCPLKIIAAETFIDVPGRYPVLRYLIRNESKKAIRYFEVDFKLMFTLPEWSKFGYGFTDSIGFDGNGPAILKPGSIYSNVPELYKEISPTPEIQVLLNNQGDSDAIKVYWTGMVTRVEFVDGTIFDARKLSRRIEQQLLKQ